MGSCGPEELVDVVSRPAGECPGSRCGEGMEMAEAGPRLKSDRLVLGEETFVAVLSNCTEDAASVSPLSFLPETLEASLGFRWRPMRPSFSIATKLVRTLDRRRGESVPAAGASAC